MKDAQITKRLAKDSFEAWADTYDRSFLQHFLFQPSYLAFLEEIAHWRTEHARPLRLLDIGCGTGTLLGMAAVSNIECEYLVGLDYAMQMCIHARRKADHAGLTPVISAIHGDSEHLPFADGSFDIITCGNSFHHYPHQQSVVAEMRRLLGPGGRLMIIDGFRDNVVGWVVFDVIIAAVEKSVHHAPWTTMRDYFTCAGFKNVRQRKLGFWFPVFITIGQVE